MKCSVVNLSEAKNSSRDFLLHPEFFGSDILKFRRKALKDGYVPLERFVGYIKRGTQPSYTKDGTIKVLRSVNVQRYGLNDIRQEYVNKDFFDVKKQGQVKYNDVLLTSTGVGTLGRALVVKSKENYFIDGHISIFRNLKDILPEFLYAYLNSCYGQNQINVLYKGSSGQIEIYPDDLKNLLIKPLTIQTKIAEIVNSAFTEQDKSKEEYEKACVLLEAELDLRTSRFNNKKCFIKTLSDVSKAARVDAEYFQPKYDNIIEKIRSYYGGSGTLGELVKQREQKFCPDKDKDYIYIELNNINQDGGLAGIELCRGEYLPTRARRRVYTDDVIVSSVEGALDKVALITSKYDKAICSTGFYVMYSDSFNPETLFCLMRSVVVQAQLKRGCSGTILTAINTDELSKVVLPKIQEETQREIKNKISQMYNHIQRAKQLLEIAVHGIEKAITENENASIKWLDAAVQQVG